MSLKNADNIVIIDIGSNTVRGVLYSSGASSDILGNKAFQSNILTHTVDGTLSAEGIFDLCSAISGIKNYFKPCTEIFAFATSAMRDVENFDEVKAIVKAKTDIGIELISGEKEAEYDYLALRSVNNEKRGTGVDLGGGSAQVVCFSEDGVTEALSLPIGVKRVRNLLCEGIIPDEKEINKIKEYIKAQISPIKTKNSRIWFMGGTAKAVSNAAEKLLNKTHITPEICDMLFELTKKDTALLKEIFKKRYDTMPVGLIVMREICNNLGADKITVTEVGVREGYLFELKKRLK